MNSEDTCELTFRLSDIVVHFRNLEGKLDVDVLSAREGMYEILRNADRNGNMNIPLSGSTKSWITKVSYKPVDLISEGRQHTDEYHLYGELTKQLTFDQYQELGRPTEIRATINFKPL